METQNLGAAFALTPEQPSVYTKVSRATWAGLAISLFAMVVIRQAFVFFVPETTFASAVLKEALIWLNAVALIVIIRRGEHLPMRSIGLGTARWWKSILWGFVIAVVSAVVVGALAYATSYGHGPGSAAFEKLPLWLITAIVFSRGHNGCSTQAQEPSSGPQQRSSEPQMAKMTVRFGRAPCRAAAT